MCLQQIERLYDLDRHNMDPHAAMLCGGGRSGNVVEIKSNEKKSSAADRRKVAAHVV